MTVVMTYGGEKYTIINVYIRDISVIERLKGNVVRGVLFAVILIRIILCWDLQG